MAEEAPVITIDGPSGVGKGTISRLLAQKFGWHLLDSGILYRLTALGAERAGIPYDNEQALATYALTLPAQFCQGEHGDTQIYLADQQVTDDIRTGHCSHNASRVAAMKAVREALLQRQRDYRRPPGLVADGRDMGTTIFPFADVKIFLTASAEVRAKRRYKQLIDKGLHVTLPALVNEIAERDARDSQRKSSPLRPASDAVIVDTTHLTIGDVFAKVLTICNQHLDR